MLSCEDCTIRVALDQSLKRLSTSPIRSNQVMTQSEIKSTEFAAYVGIDWADQKHDICLQEVGSNQVESLQLDHKPDSISNWDDENDSHKIRHKFFKWLRHIELATNTSSSEKFGSIHFATLF